MKMKLLESGTVISDSGKVLQFSIDDFTQNICLADNCFICSASRDEKEFNDEHIIPQWILKKYGLYQKFISLPNGKYFRYDKYKIPCCKECNSLLGRTFEDKICDALSKDYYMFRSFLSKHYPLLFVWMALIFLKTHLKDRFFREEFTKEEKISDSYDWETLHHIHCLVLAVCNGIAIDPEALGTLIVLPAVKSDLYDPFDYADLYYCKTMLIKFGEVAVLSVLNDSCAAMNILEDVLKRIRGRLNPLQLKELVVRFAHCNISLINRPEFFTSVDPKHNLIKIGAKLPESIDIGEFNRKEYGGMLYEFLKPALQNFQSRNREWEIEHLKAGELSYLFDENGRFNARSIIFRDESGNEIVET